MGRRTCPSYTHCSRKSVHQSPSFATSGFPLITKKIIAWHDAQRNRKKPKFGPMTATERGNS